MPLFRLIEPGNSLFALFGTVGIMSNPKEWYITHVTSCGGFWLKELGWWQIWASVAMCPSFIGMVGLLPGKSHGRRSLVGCSPWGRWGSDTTEQLPFHSSLSCIGEGNGNPLQCSFLENPRGGGAWWAAVCGVAQSRTWLKRLSSDLAAAGVVSSSFRLWWCIKHIQWDWAGHSIVYQNLS